MTDQPDETLKQALDAAARQAPDPAARERAVQAALAAFDAAQEKSAGTAQGSVPPARPISEPTDKGRSTMTKTMMTWAYSSAAAAAVLVVAVTLTWQQQQPLDGPSVLTAPGQGPQDAMRVTDVEPPMIAGEGKAKALKGDSVSVEEYVAAATAAPKPQVLEKRELSEADALAPQRSQDMPASAPVVAEAEAPMALSRVAPAGMMATEPVPQPGYRDEGRDDFDRFEDNPVKRVSEAPVSTFSIDVDTASYSFVRRQLNRGVLPQPDAVRVEEMVNYFDYAYPLPDGRKRPFSTSTLVMDSPWRPGNKLLRIGIKGYEMARAERPKTNLVFLLDVSGSMNSPDKLPLVKQSLDLLLRQLGEQDRVAIAVYAGAAGTVLPPTPASERATIRAALDKLQAGGSTAGGEGIRLAYQLAQDSFDENAVNRVILATDGDFNVGITNHDELKGYVERQRGKGIYLSVLGFGQGNYQDSLMQALAQNGNGIAAYIDTLGEAQKVLVEEATSALFPIANDVKIQLQFNPANVSEYRLIGYETRALKREDFSNDQVDAGDIGAGHTVTAIYEFTPLGESGLIEASRYEPSADGAAQHAGEYAFLRLRYKLPGQTESVLQGQPVRVEQRAADALQQREANFAVAVAGFAQLLRGGRYTGDWDYEDALALAQANKGEDAFGYRTEFVQLIRKAMLAAQQ